MTKEQVLTLRKVGLDGVCEFNGRFMWGDGRELTPEEESQVITALGWTKNRAKLEEIVLGGKKAKKKK